MAIAYTELANSASRGKKSVKVKVGVSQVLSGCGCHRVSAHVHRV